MQEATSQDAAVARGDRQHAGSQSPSEHASFRFYQRLSKNNDWDKGKSIPSATGLAIVKLLQGSEEWSSETHPQYAIAWGTHPYLPGYGAALDVIDSGIVTHYTFRTGGGLFDVNDKLWVIPPENKEALGALFATVSDKGREKFWR